jgi:redox-sensing transcriptional repressor
VEVVSSHQLARSMGVRASLVRRDLAELGGLGTPGKGYEVAAAAAAIRDRLDLTRERPTVWLGVGGRTDWTHAMEALRAVNCSLVGVFDDTDRGRIMGNLSIQPLSRAVAEVRRTDATVAVVASERAARRELLESLVEVGVRAILNLTPRRLDLPAGVVVEQCDLRAQMVRLVSRLGGDGAGQAQRDRGKHGARSAAR